MITLWIIIVLLSLLTAVGGALIALRVQCGILDRTLHEREAWQKDQENRQRTWEVRQGKHILNLEKKLGEQIKETHKQVWDKSLQVEKNQQVIKARSDIEQELLRLPRIEDIELPFSQSGPRRQPDRWQPPALYGADLRERDLSYRYLGRADLREATLTEANLYMADLSGASLTGANLERTNLVGANFSGADLRGARLSGANLLVADLHSAILHGATLQNTRNLTQEQLQTAIYDNTTILDSEMCQSAVVSPAVLEALEVSKAAPEQLVGLQGTEQPPTDTQKATPPSPKRLEAEIDEETAGLGEASTEQGADHPRKIIRLPARANTDHTSGVETKHDAEGSGVWLPLSVS